MREILRRLYGVLDRRRDDDLDAEVAAHLSLLADEYEQRGLSPAEAQRAARRAFGAIQPMTEAYRDQRGLRWVDDLRQDVGYAVRGLVRQPGFAAIAVLTLGLGIGANTAIFSAVRGVVLKPLPYTDGERLLLVRQTVPGRDEPVYVSVRELEDYRARTRSFDALVEYHQMTFDLLGRGDPDRVDVGVVSHDFFDVLGVAPLAGRGFVARDEAHDAPAVLLLSYRYWMERFGGDRSIVGQDFQMNDRPHTVIGVLPDVPL